MDATLLCNLKGASRDVFLRLRLLHMWLAKPPNSRTVYYHCCLWVDQTGMLIQAIADTAMAGDIERLLSVGSIYIIKGFGLNTARNLYRACSFGLIMNITRTTIFQECALPALDFPTDSFEIFPFGELPTRSGFHRVLTDVVGRLHSISGVDHQLTNTGTTPKQTLVLQNEQGERVSVTLWNNLAGSLNCTALIQADAIEPVIIAGWESDAFMDAKHFCGGIVKAVDSHNPWYYTSCNMCRRSCSTWGDNPYWCPTHWEISENQVTVGYKIQLTLRDVIGEAPFIVFDPCGNNLVLTSAPLLAQRYPHRSGQLPPELSALHGQYVKFEVKLPMVESNGVSTGEFRVLRVIPQQNHQIQAPVPLQIQGPMNPPHNPQPSQGNTCQAGEVAGTAELRLMSGQSSGSSPSSSSKGKEKVSGPLLFEDCKPAFQIGRLVDTPNSQSHGSEVVDEMVKNQETQVAAPLLPLTAKSIDTLKNPAALSLPHEKEIPESMSSPGQVSSNFSGYVVVGSGTPQNASPSPAQPTPLSTPSFSSPSATMLVSPLAKVKVEMLDASEMKQPQVDAHGSAPFSIESLGSTQEGSKRASAKRRLYET